MTVAMIDDPVRSATSGWACWPLTTPCDAGLNRMGVALGPFIQRLEAGEVARGCYLLVDSLNGFTQGSVKAIYMLTGAMKFDLKVVDLSKMHILERESGVGDFTRLLVQLNQPRFDRAEDTGAGHQMSATVAHGLMLADPVPNMGVVFDLLAAEDKRRDLLRRRRNIQEFVRGNKLPMEIKEDMANQALERESEITLLSTQIALLNLRLQQPRDNANLDEVYSYIEGLAALIQEVGGSVMLMVVSDALEAS